jgi:Arc/MetJ-type ribon-helix-helix transcriptional regulator
MANKKDLGSLLEQFLPKLNAFASEPETVRESLRKILEHTEHKQFLLGLEQASDPLAFAYNIYLWTQGMTKEVRGSGELKKGKTWTEKQMSRGYSPDEIDCDADQPFTSNAMIATIDGHVRLGKMRRE